jgi:hypothetical protein
VTELLYAVSQVGGAGPIRLDRRPELVAGDSVFRRSFTDGAVVAPAEYLRVTAIRKT